MQQINNWMPFVQAIRTGDQESFTTLVTQFQPLIRKLTRKFSWVAPVEDLSQEAYLALYLAVNSYQDGHNVGFPGYVEARIRYALWNYSKRMKRYHDREATLQLRNDNDGDPVDPILLVVCPVAQVNFETVELLDLFQPLSERERFAVLHLLLEKQKPGELAMECSVSVETVKTWRKRAIKKLKMEWGKS